MPDTTAPAALDPVLDHIDATLPEALDRLMALLRIPSISTDPVYAPDCARAADWLVAELRALGAEAAAHPTPGHPMVVGHLPGRGPRVLFYGHYDVQPVDPLDLWHRPPFEPEVQDTTAGRVIRGRGACDDKGQLMTFLTACRAWKAVNGPLPMEVVFFFEGEEESGSPSLIPFLEAHREMLGAELALICDTGLFDDRAPAIITSLRGLAGIEVTLTGADRDLHSGGFGGPAANPIRVLSKVLAGLHDDTGRVTLPGFYAGVPEVTADQLASWDALGFDAEGFLGSVGLSHPAGEDGRRVLEMLWSRPTCEINGITGGYTGAGFKTVLPSQASAKISFRLVGDQDPDAILAALRAYVEASVPEDVDVTFEDFGAAPASVMNTAHPAFAAARAALSDEWGMDAAFTGAGGSIPVAGYFQSILGMDSMLIGFGKTDDGIHSPNEKYDVESFRKGARSWARIFDRLRG
ncbi:M20/M25/M40 family metallo-hydrolase [Dinoroseobacter sp. PD6]|uniref:M20/M25/M40 family metallo-hydrolase n=1 Tax=Dinoroseobacter sp. PD6 TaxID=3028384 RepID=UPI00237B63A2|nr:M20/M25/M40 family metallo-hydrolase [Dinoroseobacter sp. PD6]MDD9716023.1 M20/M25/M40 family metallo-hydrolase [Dinoroseobacter sp. PD6]